MVGDWQGGKQRHGTWVYTRVLKNPIKELSRVLVGGWDQVSRETKLPKKEF